MPELPEVESTARALKEKIIGLTIGGVEVHWDRMVRPNTPESLKKRIRNKEVIDVTRRGKYLLFLLEKKGESAGVILSHLRMSGRMRVENKSIPRSKYDRIVMSFTNGEELRFSDPRKFGRFAFRTEEEIEEFSDELGPEPLEDSFTSSELLTILRRSKRGVKALLLDQSYIVGLGNIYVDESLWAANIHPLRRGHTIESDEAKRLHRAIRRILKKAIELNGTDFGDGVVYNGKFTPNVYGRAQKPCKVCKSELERLVVAGRGTVVCNCCQVLGE